MRKSRNVPWAECSLSGLIHIKCILNHGCRSSGPRLHISVSFVSSVCERWVYVVISEPLKLSAGKYILFLSKGSHYVLSYFFIFMPCSFYLFYSSVPPFAHSFSRMIEKMKPPHIFVMRQTNTPVSPEPWRGEPNVLIETWLKKKEDWQKA